MERRAHTSQFVSAESAEPLADAMVVLDYLHQQLNVCQSSEVRDSILGQINETLALIADLKQSCGK